MTTVTQKIPNLLGGISQQPDNKKVPGQVRDSLNTFPEYALGLMKRPGGKFEAPLRGAVNNGHWFSILGEDAKYVGQLYFYGGDITKPDIKIWYKESGIPRGVDFTGYAGYNAGVVAPVVATITAESTAFGNVYGVNGALSIFKNQANLYLTAVNAFNEQLSSSFQIDATYNTDDGTVTRTINTAVVKTGADYTFYKDGVSLGTAQSTSITVNNIEYRTGTNRSEDNLNDDIYAPVNPNAYNFGVLNGPVLYELVTVTPGSGNTLPTPPAAPSFTALETAQQATDATLFDPGDSAVQASSTRYFENDKDTAPLDIQNDLKFVTIQDTTFVLNKKKRVQWLANSKTPELKFDEAFVNFNVLTLANGGSYEITITRLLNDSTGKQPHEEGYVRNEDTSFNTSTSPNTSSITASVTYAATTADTVSLMVNGDPNTPGSGFNALFLADAGSTNWGTFTFQATGTGIYIKDSQYQFDITVSGPTDQSIEVFRHEISDVGKLPVQAKNGYKVKVINSTDVTVDDMYMEYRSENGEDYSPGNWFESNAPGIDYVIDKNTMPHALKVNANGVFEFKAWDFWEDRRVGDEETNPTPHFITDGNNHRYINDMFMYRNRMGFLAGDSIILSRAGHFFDFFAKSSLATAPDDPIDSSVSTTDPVELFYTHQESVGLVIFGQSQQFLLTTESDLLSPTTAKINKLSGFNAEPLLPAISLGSSSAFFSKTSDNTKFFELQRVSNVEAPQYSEKTKPVPELLPSTIDTVTASPAVSLVSFGQRGTDTIYNFNFYRTGGEEITNTWYRWKLPGTLEHQFFDDNTYNTVIKSGNNHYLTSFRVAQSSSQGFIDLESGSKTNLCLDMWYNEPIVEYDSVSDQSTILYPYEPLQGTTPVLVVYGDSTNETITTFDENTTQYIKIPGNYVGKKMVLGYQYDMLIELPRFYLVQAGGEGRFDADTTSQLIVHRLKVKTGLSGSVDYKVKILGITDRTQTITAAQANRYLLNSVNLTEGTTHVIPLYQRNNNLSVTICGSTPYPVTIESLNWEGRYASNFYKRA